MNTSTDNFFNSKINMIHKLYKINQLELALRYKEMELKKISEKVGRRKSKNLFLKVRHKGPALDSDIVNRDKNLKKLKIINEEEDNKNKFVEKKFSIEEICKSSSVFRDYIETQKRNKEKNKILKTEDDFLNADFQNFLSKLNNEFDKKNEKFFHRSQIDEEIFNEQNRQFNSYHSDKYIFNKDYNRINLHKIKPIKLIKHKQPSILNTSFEKRKNLKNPNKKNSFRFSINSISKQELEINKKENEIPNAKKSEIEIEIENNNLNNEKINSNNTEIINNQNRYSIRTIDSLTKRNLNKKKESFHKKNLSESDGHKYISLINLFDDESFLKKNDSINNIFSHRNFSINNKRINLSSPLIKKKTQIHIPKSIRKVRNYSEEKFIIEKNKLEKLKKINKIYLKKIQKDKEDKNRNELNRELNKVDFVTNNILKMLEETTNYFSEKVDILINRKKH